MLHFRCVGCQRWIGAADADIGRSVACRRCGHLTVCPPAGTSGAALTARRRGGVPGGWLLALCSGAAVTLLGWIAWPALRPMAGPGPGETPAASAADTRQEELLQENAGRRSDPDLAESYRAINQQFFDGALPPVSVRWEPGLSEVGGLASNDFILEGMFGRLRSDLLILVNPHVRGDKRAIDRVLCHEMVHLYLHTVGDNSTNHGPAFQSVLSRLSRQGAFEGVQGNEEEKVRLRAWLDVESARLSVDEREVARLSADIVHEREELEAQIATANTRSTGPSPRDGTAGADIQALEARRDEFNSRVLEINARVERGREALAHFNREVVRYNLMAVYPDGIDEESRVSPKSPPPGFQR